MANYDTDYDLAILGGGLSSRVAACAAAQRGARVALIAPNWLVADATHYTWQALCCFKSGSSSAVNWPSWCDWIHYQCGHTALSPGRLNSQGIDVILEPASFTKARQLKLKNRYLKASRYLLTDGYGASAPTIHGGLFCHQLAQLETIPERVAVIGYGATVVEWAYALSRSTMVTLILLDQSLLPAEDRDIQRLTGAQLKSLGIKIVFSNDHPQTNRGAEQWNAAKQWHIDQWIVVPQPHAWKTLALENIGVAPQLPIAVNRYLQTRCPQLYVSGSSLGGENRLELTQQEIHIALENVLFGRRHVMHYEQAFYGIHLLSPVGRWGLTEHQAKQRYGQDVQIFQGFCLPEVANHVAQTNFCKLITLGQRIIGVHLMGDGAPALVAALGKSPRMQILNQWVTAHFKPGTLQAAIHQAIAQWQRNRWSPGQWRRDWAENWFNFRRSL